MNGYDLYTLLVITDCPACEVEIEKEFEAEGGACEVKCDACGYRWTKELR